MTKKKIYDQITDEEADELERMVDEIIAGRNRLIEMDKNWLVTKWPKIFTFQNVKDYPVSHLFDELGLGSTLCARYHNIKSNREAYMQKNDDYYRILEALKNELNGTDDK